MNITKTLLASAAVLALVPAHAVINVTSPAFVYTENFNTLTITPSTTVPWANDSTLNGWSLFNSVSAAITTYGADTGTSNQGLFRSYGATDVAERALGSVASSNAYFGLPATNAVAGWIALALTNISGGTLGGFTLNYSGEQWRNGGNTAAQSLTLEYGYGATFGTVATWTAAGAGFNFTSPVVGATAAAVDGNVAGLVTGLGGTVNTSWAAGSTLWLRWADVNDTGSDHGLAIDNLSLSIPAAVPEPGTYALFFAGIAALGFVARRRA
jgi:hypothetical protein